MTWQRRRADRRTTSEDAPDSGRITDIRSQERDPSRVSVFLDGVYAFGIATAKSVEQGLHIGDDLSPERVAALRALDEVGRATEAAVRLLGVRPRSVREVRDRLRQHGYGPEAIEAAVEKLEGWHYVDDADFARFWVENRERHKPRGRRLLEQELRQKGIDRETIVQTLDEAELDEWASALELARARVKNYAGLEPSVARRRLGGLLARRGYGGEEIRRSLDQVFGEASDDDEDESKSQGE